MYFPTTRVLTILELLQSRERMSGPELAARLEVDTRTIRRYITMLQDLGIPVEAERGRYGSYRLRPGFKLPPLMFNDDEALALTLGLLVSRKLGMAATAPAVEGALAKIERVLPLALREHVLAVQETLVLDVQQGGPAPHIDVVLTLSLAVRKMRRVQLRYLSWKGEESERALDPYGLVYRPGYWYTVGYCHLRHDLRIFRLDRIVEASLCDETFTRPDNFDCLDYITRSLAQTPSTWPVEVILDMTLEEARYHIPPVVATLEQQVEGVLLRCSASSLDWIARLLISLGCSFVVKQPPELREELHRQAERIAALAERTV